MDNGGKKRKTPCSSLTFVTAFRDIDSLAVAVALAMGPAKGTATMSAFLSPHGYQSMHSPNGGLQLPSYYGLPPPPRVYPNLYDP